MIRNVVTVPFLSLVLIFTGLPAASAQASAEEVRAFGAWALEVSQATIDAIAVMETSIEPDDIVAEYSAGDITAQSGLNRLDLWRAETDQQIADLIRRADLLGEGPALAPPGFEEMIASMSDMPLRAVGALTDYLDEVEAYTRAVLNGQDGDVNQTVIARFSVLQTYYSALASANAVSIETMEASHPQYHLLQAMVRNMQSTVLILELTNQSLGADPSAFAIDDTRARITENRDFILAAVDRGLAAYENWMSTLSEQGAAALGMTANQHAVLTTMMETYPASFQAERFGAGLHFEALDQLDLASGDGSRFERFTDNLVSYETQRDTQQMQRQQLVSQF